MWLTMTSPLYFSIGKKDKRKFLSMACLLGSLTGGKGGEFVCIY